MHDFVESQTNPGFCAECGWNPSNGLHRPPSATRKRGAIEAIELCERVRAANELAAPYHPTLSAVIADLAQAIEALAREVMENARGEV